MSHEQDVARNYRKQDLTNRLLAVLTEAGLDIDALTVDDLAPVDAFHVRGRQATLDLLAIADVQPGEPILDAGSGIGGTARLLAMNAAGPVVGVDLTPEYCAAATELTRRVGLSDRVTFRQGSVLDLPYEDETFAMVWTEHVQMNIADKEALYTEFHRVLRKGRLVFHDIFQGEGGDVQYPVPWAGDPSISHLIPPGELRDLLGRIGFREVVWRDCSDESIAWFEDMLARREAEGAPLVGLHLLMEDAETKLPNVFRNLKERRIRVVQAVFEKPH